MSPVQRDRFGLWFWIIVALIMTCNQGARIRKLEQRLDYHIQDTVKP